MGTRRVFRGLCDDRFFASHTTKAFGVSQSAALCFPPFLSAHAGVGGEPSFLATDSSHVSSPPPVAADD